MFTFLIQLHTIWKVSVAYFPSMSALVIYNGTEHRTATFLQTLTLSNRFIFPIGTYFVSLSERNIEVHVFLLTHIAFELGRH